MYYKCKYNALQLVVPGRTYTACLPIAQTPSPKNIVLLMSYLGNVNS